MPGITAASGCAAYAGIPLTHRDVAQSCVFVTGHQSAEGGDVDWRSLAVANQTLVIYMGLGALAGICQALMQHGLDEQTPLAVIERGTMRTQKVTEGSLAAMAQGSHQDFRSPGLVIIGEVVRLRSRLGWFENYDSPPF